MAYLNKVTLMGNLGATPEIRYLANGDCIANFSLATTEKWFDKATGLKKESTEWHYIVAFKKLAEICGRFLKKGSSVYCEGRLYTKKYTDKNGVDKYQTKIIIDTMKMLDKFTENDSFVPKKNSPEKDLTILDEINAREKTLPNSEIRDFDDITF